MSSKFLISDISSKIVKGLLGFGFLAISQIAIQSQTYVKTDNEWKSSFLFPATSEKSLSFQFNLNQYSTMMSLSLSLAGTGHYAFPDKYSWTLLIPWLLNCTFYWISSSITSLKNLIVSFESNDFWMMFALTVLIMLLKLLLMSEVFFLVWESLTKIFSWQKEITKLFIGLNGEKSENMDSDGGVFKQSFKI